MDEFKKVGRPTDYKKEYCELLIEHMAAGFSFESFAGKVGASKQTIYDWMTKNVEFLDARKKGDALSLLWWEKEGKDGMWSGKQFNAAIWMINMKNRHGWRDRVEMKSTVKIDSEAVQKLSDEDLVQTIKEALKGLESNPSDE